MGKPLNYPYWDEMSLQWVSEHGNVTDRTLTHAPATSDEQSCTFGQARALAAGELSAFGLDDVCHIQNATDTTISHADAVDGNESATLNQVNRAVQALVLPTQLPNPYALTIQQNGATIATYTGVSAVTANLTTNAYGVQQYLSQSAVTLTSGTAVQVGSLTSQKAGLMEVELLVSIRATATSLVGLISSDGMFASATVSIRVNGTSLHTQLVQVPRSGTGDNDTDLRRVSALLTLEVGSVVTVLITANESGLSIPANGNTRLWIKG